MLRIADKHSAKTVCNWQAERRDCKSKLHGDEMEGWT